MITPAKTASLPSTHFEHFEGPLALLLDEVRRQNVAIEKIAMAPIVARFLEYIRTAAEHQINLDIEYVHMAATLIHWKSQSLLPPDTMAEPAAEVIRDSIVKQLLAHRKQAAEELARRRSREQTRCSRLAQEFGEEAGPDESTFISVWDLMQQARDISRWAREYRAGQSRWRESFGVEADDVTVAEMIDTLQELIHREDVALEGVSLLQEQIPVSRKVCLFLGMLELVRRREMGITQWEHFGPILLQRLRH